jgi:hypothetical protein
MCQKLAEHLNFHVSKRKDRKDKHNFFEKTPPESFGPVRVKPMFPPKNERTNSTLLL